MKIAVTGKGGVGKTTLSGTLARLLAADGYRVLAVDADPDANLASALGIPEENYRGITPFAKMKALAEERTGADGGYGTFFILNPKVDDLPEQFCVEHEGIKLLLMGTVEQGGSGCVCPEHTLIKRLMQHLLVQRDEVVIMDMEAGIEHLGRGTAGAVDALIVVVEPGRRSVQTARQIQELAHDLGIQRVFMVASKVRSTEDLAFVGEALSDFPLLGHVTFSREIMDADLEGKALFDLGGEPVAEIRKIKENLIQLISSMDE
ncbi:AAA family ATPase [Desulfitobacterium hafniense]|uniref:Carbon monoxide dehydrogenase maturation factor n=2 Tax=Desulfitobacterium hafniense TaxID=49338 RepID=Q24U72_DESHY|nr:carbon monoxide dehydrogenase accessory protein CooC [Desulfitobacterium hafniense]KTE90179.1 carbon monoxide dehydrogenase [Desulfitobacterium hafniense]BAE84420.1 carbon monoxide dehydrogenase maturation factor [Desulfitobacterium hafniense Y51]